MSTCIKCGTEMEESREDVEYDALPGTVLSGVIVAKCPECGAKETRIPRMAELERTLAEMIIDQNTKLAPKEIRFLRKYLGLSGKDLAAKMGVEPETVSRWENGKKRPSPMADQLIRTMAACESPIEDYSSPAPAKDLGEPQPWKAQLALDDNWHPTTTR